MPETKLAALNQVVLVWHGNRPRLGTVTAIDGDTATVTLAGGNEWVGPLHQAQRVLL